MIEMPLGMTSFLDVRRACEAATKQQDIAHAVILGKHVFAAPGDNPHALYKTYFPGMHSAEFMDEYYRGRIA